MAQDRLSHRTHRMKSINSPGFRLATIWQTYGPYHLARVWALEKALPEAKIICVSHCTTDKGTYPFFDKLPSNHLIVSPGDSSEIAFAPALIRALRCLHQAKP